MEYAEKYPIKQYLMKKNIYMYCINCVLLKTEDTNKVNQNTNNKHESDLKYTDRNWG